MSTHQVTPLSPDELRRIHAYWRACNYLAAGMIYLRDNPLLKEPLRPEHIKKRLLGHWGSSPGLAFTYVRRGVKVGVFVCVGTGVRVAVAVNVLVGV